MAEDAGASGEMVQKVIGQDILRTQAICLFVWNALPLVERSHVFIVWALGAPAGFVIQVVAVLEE